MQSRNLVVWDPVTDTKLTGLCHVTKTGKFILKTRSYFMTQHNELNDFLLRNQVEQTDWESSGLEWATLKAIASDHDSQAEHLRDAAAFLARTLQRFPTVHSVRWRVKDTDHLLKKIIRKRIAGNEKYKSISVDNYFEIVTDLVGLRALHLFKDECFAINANLREKCVHTEPPIAYIREGDSQEWSDRFRSSGFKVEKHEAGYRSVHYV